jgi:hypothetical protein
MLRVSMDIEYIFHRRGECAARCHNPPGGSLRPWHSERFLGHEMLIALHGRAGSSLR